MADDLIKPVKIQGLKEFRKSLRETKAELPRALRLAFNASVEIVVDDAKPLVSSDTGAASGSIRAQSNQTSAKIVAGGRKAPYYPWLDFGGKVGKYRQVERAWKREGRYIYPVYRNKRDSGKFEEVLSEQLLAVANDAGLEMEVSN